MSQVVPIKIKADTGQAVKNIDKVGAALDETAQSSKKVTADVSEMGGQLDTVSGGAITKFKGLTGTLRSVGKGFITLKGAIISSGIGALALIIGSIVMAFKDSEEGQNKFAKIMGVIGSVVGNLTDKLSDLGMAIIDTFTNPVESVKAIGDTIQDFVIDKVNKLLEGFGLLGSALKKAFSGDFKGALSDAGDGFVAINRAVNPVVIATEALVKGIDNTIAATKRLGKEIAEDAKNAAKIADVRAKADIKERNLIVARAEANRDRAKLLEQAIDKENFTTKQRIGFLEEAAALEEKITNQEIEAARLRAEAKILENTLSKSTKEDMIEEEQLKARLIELETAKLTKAKEVTGQIIALKAEEAAGLKAIQDQADAEDALKEEKKLADQKLEDERIAKILALTDLEILNARQKLQRDRDNALAELDLLDATEAEKQKIRDHYAAEEQKIDELTTDNKLDLASNAMGDLASLFGEESKAGKAAAIAQTTIETYKGATSAYASLAGIPIVGPALGAISAAAAVAAGFANVKKITSIGPPVGGASGGGAAIPSAPPAFNVIGSSPENQLAEAISGDNKKPVKAFVVSSDVSSAQSLDRNIIENASIG